MQIKIDITECKTKEEQIAKIFEGLMDRKLITEARIYSLVFAHLHKKQVAPNLTYADMCKAFVEMKEIPPNETDFRKAMKNLAKTEIKFTDEKKKRRSVNLIKETPNV